MTLEEEYEQAKTDFAAAKRRGAKGMVLKMYRQRQSKVALLLQRKKEIISLIEMEPQLLAALVSIKENKVPEPHYFKVVLPDGTQKLFKADDLLHKIRTWKNDPEFTTKKS